MACLAKPIPGSEWERHSEMIHDLYHVQGLPLHSNKDEPSVMQIMREKHNFDASISQYERHFKKRNRPKHLKKSEWRAVHATLSRLSTKKIAARVKLSGEILSDERVKRSMRRAFVGPAQPASAIDTVPLPPDRVTIETRGTDGEWITYTGVGSAPGNNSVHHILEGSLRVAPTPIHSEILQNPVESQYNDNSTALDLMGSPSLVNSSSFQAFLPSDAVSPALEPFPLLRENPDFSENIASSAVIQEPVFSEIFGTQFPLQSVESLSYSSFHSTTFTSLPRWHEDISPFSEFQTAISSLCSQGNRSWHQILSQNGTRNEDDPISRPVSQQSTESAILSLLTSFDEQRSGELGSSNNVKNLDFRDVLDSLRSLVPEGLLSRVVLDEPTEPYSRVALFGSPIYHAIMFSLLNGFAGPENMPAGMFFNMIKTQTHMTSLLFNSLQSCRPALAKSLVDNLFRAAVEACDEQAVKAILHFAQRSSVPIDPNSVRCSMEDKSGSFTPLEVASHFGNISIVKALLDAKADTNLPSTSFYGSRTGALWFAIYKDNTYESINMELVQLLLDHGAKVTLVVVWHVIDLEMDDLLQKIICRLQPNEHDKCDCEPFMGSDVRCLLKAATYPEQKLATSVLTKIFKHFYDRHNFGSSREDTEILEDVTFDAMMARNVALSEFLLPHLRYKGLALAVAIRSGSKELIDLSLLHGSTTGGPTYLICNVTNLETGRFTERIHSPQKSHRRTSWVSGYHHRCSPFDEPENYMQQGFSSSSYPTSPLAEAIRSRDDSLIRRLLELGALSHICDEEHLKAVAYAAAEAGNCHYLRVALKQVPHMKKQRQFLGQALNLAVLNDQFEAIEDLLRAGADACIGKAEILLSSLRMKNYTTFDWTMESGFDYSFKAWSSKIIDAAIRWGDMSIVTDILSVTVLLYSGYKFSESLVTAVKSRNKDIVKLLLDYDAGQYTNQLDFGGSASPLGIALSNRDNDIIRLLITTGMDPADSSAFASAIETDDQRVSNFLFESFSKRYPQGRKGFGGDLLIDAMQEERFAAIDRMLAVKFDVNTIARKYETVRPWWKFPSGMTAEGINSLGYAILLRKGKCLGLVQKLINAGGDPNQIAWVETGPQDYLTPLLLAIKMRSTEMAQLLLDKGADIHRPARRGVRSTPLQLACKIGSMKLVKFLLEKGATLNEPPAQFAGATALQEAAGSGNTEISKLLIAHGADVHGPRARERGHTALEGAAGKGRIDMIRVLWDAAQWRPFASTEVNSAVELARTNGHRGCAEYLVELQQQTPSYSDLAQGNPFLIADLG